MIGVVFGYNRFEVQQINCSQYSNSITVYNILKTNHMKHLIW